MESPSFSALFDHIAKTGAEFVLFGLVENEVLAKYSRDFAEKVADRWNKKIKGALVSEELAPKPELEPQLKALKSRLLNPTSKVQTIRMNNYDGVALEEVVRRGINRVPPANSSGEELRDVILWLSILEFARKRNHEVVYITNDSGFWNDKSDEPLPQIQEDIAKMKAPIKLYRRIETFLASNVLQRNAVDKAWAAQLFNDKKLGDLLSERVASQEHAGTLVSYAVVSQQLEEGSVYEIGSGATFAELVFKVDLELELQTYIFRSSGSTQISSTSEFGWVGQIPSAVIDWHLPDRSFRTQPWAWDVAGSAVRFENRPLNVISSSGILGGRVIPAQLSGFPATSAEPVVDTVTVTARAKYSVRIVEQKPTEVSLDSYEILDSGRKSGSAEAASLENKQ
jgi:hypothetical protein